MFSTVMNSHALRVAKGKITFLSNDSEAIYVQPEKDMFFNGESVRIPIIKNQTLRLSKDGVLIVDRFSNVIYIKEQEGSGRK